MSRLARGRYACEAVPASLHCLLSSSCSLRSYCSCIFSKRSCSCRLICYNLLTSSADFSSSCTRSMFPSMSFIFAFVCSISC